MKNEPLDPPRIGEQEGAPLHRLVHAVRRGGPSDAAMERVARNLSAASNTEAASPLHRSCAVTKGASYMIGALALATASAIALTWQSANDEHPTTHASSTSRELASPAPSTANGDTVAPTPPQSNVTVVSVDTLPVASAPPTTSSSGARGGGLPARSPTELELLQQSQAALASEPARALVITTEQARRYPSGEFVQEREVIAVEALARLGRTDEALRRARDLVERFPRTPYAARLAVAVGQPVSPGSSAPTATAHGAGERLPAVTTP